MVPIATVTTWKSAPGERDELLKVFAMAKIIHERHGGRVRMWAVGAGGTSFGQLLYMVEHDDYATYAAWQASLAMDPEWHELAPVLFNESPGTVLSSQMLSELIF